MSVEMERIGLLRNPQGSGSQHKNESAWQHLMFVKTRYPRRRSLEHLSESASRTNTPEASQPCFKSAVP
jgi:hypothetical protein